MFSLLFSSLISFSITFGCLTVLDTSERASTVFGWFGRSVGRLVWTCNTCVRCTRLWIVVVVVNFCTSFVWKYFLSHLRNIHCYFLIYFSFFFCFSQLNVWFIRRNFFSHFILYLSVSIFFSLATTTKMCRFIAAVEIDHKQSSSIWRVFGTTNMLLFICK